MPEEYPKEYEIEVNYDVTTIESKFQTVRVEAFDEDEALKKAKDKIWDQEPIDDYNDTIEFLELKITKEVSTEPGFRDDKTIDMFEEEE